MNPKACARTLLALAAALAALPAAAQTRLGEGCDLAVLGVGSTASFLRFDADLRKAAQARDAQALAGLLQFPLALNIGSQRATIANAADWQARFAGDFAAKAWSVLDRSVTGQPPGALFCNADGVMYGNGQLWANPDGTAFRVSAINLPQNLAAPGAHAASPAALLSCSTDRHEIVIDATGDASSRYRAWNKPHAPPDPPALELAGKAADGEGTGQCFHRTWRFHNGSAGYVISEPGCNDGSVPAGAKARLVVSIAGKTALEAWCR